MGNFAMTIWNSTCNPCFSTFDQIFFVFHGLKTIFFCYSLKLNFICYPNRFFTYDYSLWDGGDLRFCGQKQTLINYWYSPLIPFVVKLIFNSPDPNDGVNYYHHLSVVDTDLYSRRPSSVGVNLLSWTFIWIEWNQICRESPLGSKSCRGGGK
jgi:hypothetical protein